MLVYQRVFPPLQTQILQCSHRTMVAEVNDILRTGNDITVAGYCMYGAATEMVITFKGDTLSRQGRQMATGDHLIWCGIALRISQDIFPGIWFQKNVDFDRFWSYVSYCIICLMCICVKTEDPWKPQFPVAIVGIWPWHLAGGNPDLFSYRKWKPWIAM